MLKFLIRNGLIFAIAALAVSTIAQGFMIRECKAIINSQQQAINQLTQSHNATTNAVNDLIKLLEK